jgi:RNA polymerase sigma-70 factor (ECF subfamily)
MAYAVVRGVLGDRDEVDDVMQLVYLKAYKGLSSFRGDAKFSSWLYQIARREALDAATRRRVETLDVDEIALAAPDAQSADRVLHERDTREHLSAAMAEIDPRYREAIELRYMAEKSYEEIGELMGLPAGTVKTYVHRGKIELRRILSRPDWRVRAQEP